MAAITGVDRWVLSGSLLRWNDELTPLFDLVVFLYIPPQTRIARLLAGERQRYGDEIDPGGRQYASNQAFMASARGYESGGNAGEQPRQRSGVAIAPDPPRGRD